MQWPKACAAIVPCWNESLTIGGLVRELQRALPAVYVVDDGSTDATGRRASEAGARVLVHAVNRGKGAALCTGLREAGRAGYDWAVLLDGDGQHGPADLGAFFTRAEESQADLVVGDRMAGVQGMSRIRRVTNRWMSRQISQLAGVPLADSQCGYRLVRIEAWSRLSLRTSHFEIESEMLLAFVRAGLRVEFVPVAVLDARRPSRIRVLTDAWRWCRWRWTAGRAASSAGTGARCCAAESVS
jgi:glycosyltransferase involved in cell wall biosynthesis